MTRMSRQAYSDTLVWANSIRTEMGLDKLDRLPKGRKASSFSCPIANALDRRYTVGLEKAVGLYGGPAAIELPPYARRFVRLFDNDAYPELIA